MLTWLCIDHCFPASKPAPGHAVSAYASVCSQPQVPWVTPALCCTSRSHMNLPDCPVLAGCTSAFDAVDKVDPYNTQLMDAMWAYFSHNMEVVNFWLASCVLPTETKQYPSRLTATAWHLAQRPSKGRGLAGFSGTNDNHWLLPSQVQQVPLYDAPELQGTNGKMLDMLLRHARYITLLLPHDNAQVRVQPKVIIVFGGCVGSNHLHPWSP